MRKVPPNKASQGVYTIQLRSRILASEGALVQLSEVWGLMAELEAARCMQMCKRIVKARRGFGDEAVGSVLRTRKTRNEVMDVEGRACEICISFPTFWSKSSRRTEGWRRVWMDGWMDACAS